LAAALYEPWSSTATKCSSCRKFIDFLLGQPRFRIQFQ
jgi:hypothetical protein